MARPCFLAKIVSLQQRVTQKLEQDFPPSSHRWTPSLDSAPLLMMVVRALASDTAPEFAAEQSRHGRTSGT